MIDGEDDESDESDDDILEEDDENEGDLKIGDESNEVKEVATRVSKTRSLEACHKCFYLNCCSLSCTQRGWCTCAIFQGQEDKDEDEDDDDEDDSDDDVEMDGDNAPSTSKRTFSSAVLQSGTSSLDLALLLEFLKYMCF